MKVGEGANVVMLFCPSNLQASSALVISEVDGAKADQEWPARRRSPALSRLSLAPPDHPSKTPKNVGIINRLPPVRLWWCATDSSRICYMLYLNFISIFDAFGFKGAFRTNATILGKTEEATYR